MEKDAGIHRISSLIDCLNVSRNEFANVTGIKATTLNTILTKNKSLKTRYYSMILKAYPAVNKEWLMEGKGEMFLDEVGEAAERYGSIKMERTITLNYTDYSALIDTIRSQQKTIESIVKKEDADAV